MITTHDIGQEGSRKAGKLKGAGPHFTKARGPSGGLPGAARPQEELRPYWVGPGWRVKEPGTHWAGSRQEGLGQGPAKPVWMMLGLLAESPSHVL